MYIVKGVVLILVYVDQLQSIWSIESTPYINHLANYVNLVSAYYSSGYSTTDFLPIQNHANAMAVTVDMSLYALNGFDEVAGNIDLMGGLTMRWTDETPSIHSITFRIDGRDSFMVPYDQIWTPKLVLTNAIDSSSEVGHSAFLCRFNMTNYEVSWKPRVTVGGSCTPDVTFYPFDKQECEFIYTTWGFEYTELLLNVTRDEWDVSEYGESGEWDIEKTTSTSYILNSQSYVKFSLSIIRKPLYYAFNILLPVLVLCLLNGTVFLLPAESGERVGFSITCFLSFMVLLNMIMDILPRSSNPISFLCYYLVVMMSTSGAMTLITILLMRVYHKPEKEEVPKWMQRTITFINCGCAKLRCCVLCCRFLKESCSCKDKRWCRCQTAKADKVKKVKVQKGKHTKSKAASETDVKQKADTSNGDQKVQIQRNYTCFSALKQKCFNLKSQPMNEDEENVLDSIETKRTSQCFQFVKCKYDGPQNTSTCFPFIKSRKISSATGTENPTETQTQVFAKDPAKDDNDQDDKTKKTQQSNHHTAATEDSLAVGLEQWKDATQSQMGKKGNSLEPILQPQPEASPCSDDVKSKPPTPYVQRKKSDVASLRRNSKASNKKKLTRRKSVQQMEHQILQNQLALELQKIKMQRRASVANPTELRDSKIGSSSVKSIASSVEISPVASESESEDSLADLEEEVTWAEVGRVLDFFFMLAFTSGQAFFTVVFLVPLFTANSGDSTAA